MKILTIIFCLFLSTGAFAQSRQIAHADSLKTNNVKSNHKIDSVLLVVNDTIYTKGIQSINPESVKSIHVLKPKEASAIYGLKGINGALLIRTIGQKDTKDTATTVIWLRGSALGVARYEK